MTTQHIETLRFILGDQLNASHSWFDKQDPGVLYVLAEIHDEATYTRHHIQKVCAFFDAMEKFSQELRQAGHNTHYLTLDDTAEFLSIPSLISHLVNQYQPLKIEFQRPDEYRLLQQFQRIQIPEVELNIVDTEHFLLNFEQIEQTFPRSKHVKMEFFYRRMRKRYSILMDHDKPVGGKWNYDINNRKKIPKSSISQVPRPMLFSHDVTEIRVRLERHNISTIGELEGELIWPTTRDESLELLHHFCENCLPNFGRYQDAMTEDSPDGWSLYHCRLSFSLNTKLLHPKEVISAAIEAYEQNQAIDLSQIEGFVRQILGWREYIRGVYWANMPDYQHLNALAGQRSLPSFFWNGNTKMSCMKAAIGQSLKYSYAHHIQRLMVTGNFCLLTGIDPNDVDAWYLGIYIDAIEWVEMPNTRGMALFADGGIVGTKPYAASGSYINKMSDYCKGCHYDVKLRVGCNACPFNSLYWNFMSKHRDKIATNPRVGMIYRSWDALDDDQQSEVIERAQFILSNIESL